MKLALRRHGGSPRDLSVPIQVLVYALLLVGALVMVLPFVWMASTACKPPVELNKVPVTFLPENPVCRQNLDTLYSTSPYFNRYLLNSALVTIGAAHQLYSSDPLGSPAPAIPVSPYINVINGKVWLAQADAMDLAYRWWQEVTTTYVIGPVGVRTSSSAPTSST